MPAPMFTSNPAEYTRLEQLYITERTPPGAITGRFLGVVGIGGVCVRGPIGKVVEITSPARFIEVFGERDYGSGGTYLGEVHKALLNKPFGKVCVVRALAAAAAIASFDWETTAGGGGTAVLRIAAANPGLWGNDVSFKVEAASDGNGNHFNLTIRYLGRTYLLKDCSTHTGEDNLATKVASVWDEDAALVTLTKLASGRPVNTAAGIDGADADAYVNLGETVAAFASVAGTEGAIADSDFTATGKVLDLLANYKGIGIVMVAGRSNAAIKAGVLTKAAASSDRLFLVCPDAESTSQASAITEAGTLRSDRVVYCFDHTYTMDPSTAAQIIVEPHSWMASILSQNDVDIHPGEEDTKTQTAGIRRLYNESLAREDYASLRAAGICALEKDDLGGFLFVSGVTTSLTSGKTEITRRRMADFLQLSAADRLRYYVKKKMTEDRIAALGGELNAFCEDLKRSQRVVEQYNVDLESLNTETQKAQGLFKVRWDVQTIRHFLHLVVETNISTAELTITEAA